MRLERAGTVLERHLIHQGTAIRVHHIRHETGNK
jgi:hypothetical protein